MRNKTLALNWCLVVALLTAAPDSPRAEVRASTHGTVVYTLILGIIEDPDPMGAIYWQPVLGEPDATVLNPDGDQRNDGRPSIAYYAENNWPVVVWSYGVGSDFDIAFAEWTGSEWSQVEFLTSSTENEQDPRVFVDASSNVHVIWWEPDTEDVWLTHRSAGSDVWTTPELVASGRRPSVAINGEETLVAFERDADDDDEQEVVVLSWQGANPPSEVVVATTSRSDALDPVLHVASGQIWVDWKHADDELAYSQRVDGVWTTPQTVPWAHLSWVSEEESRSLVQSQILGP